MRFDWSIAKNLNTWDVFWMRQCLIARWRVGGGLQVLLNIWLMPGVWSFSVLKSHMSCCLCLFLCIVVRQ